MRHFIITFCLTFTYLRPCGNMLNQHMSDDLSHLQGCPAATLQPRLFGFYTRRMHVSAFSPVYILGVITRNSFRPEPSFRPKTIRIGYIVTQALVPFSITWFTVNPTVALHEVTPADSTTMNVLFTGLALFGGKSG